MVISTASFSGSTFTASERQMVEAACNNVVRLSYSALRYYKLSYILSSQRFSCKMGLQYK